jgi:hypothetical protein
MRKFFFVCFFSLASAFGLFSCGMHDMLQFDGNVTEAKMVKALQEALVLGSQTAALNLGDSSCESNLAKIGECTKGYLGNKLVEIALPDTIKNVLNAINSISSLLPSGVSSKVRSYGDSIRIALNRGAEKAAPESVNVFKNAIFGMSFSDAKGVLLGDSIAATSYLKVNTYSGLQDAFGPILEQPLRSLGIDRYWEPIASTYNPFAKTLGKAALPTDFSEYLTKYATGKALDGLFLMVGKQETKLRIDPLGAVRDAGSLVSDATGSLLSDVFGKAKDGSL